VTWSDVAVAAAFVIGIVVGGLGVIRITRTSVEYLRDERRRSDDRDQ
jgi:uncharacterized membrane-anchored protein YhcB (DUF1043 family)